jgi:hypothetical protein
MGGYLSSIRARCKKEKEKREKEKIGKSQKSCKK